MYPIAAWDCALPGGVSPAIERGREDAVAPAIVDRALKRRGVRRLRTQGAV
jgi:hypothetical protein